MPGPETRPRPSLTLINGKPSYNATDSDHVDKLAVS